MQATIPHMIDSGDWNVPVPTTTPAIPDAVVGGGYLVLRRNSVGRLKAPRCPYEHGSLASATEEAERMSRLNPGRTYLACYVVSEHTEPEAAG
jgi:hypothetical protein